MNFRYHGGENDVLFDFSVNLNPLVDRNEIAKELSSLADTAMKYPEQRPESLVSLISKIYQIEKSNIFVGNGSIELFYYLLDILKPKRVVTLEPTFCEYSYIAELRQIPLKRVLAVDNFRWDVYALAAELSKDDVVFVCNPNNPTGSIFDKEEIKILLKTGAFIVVDEAFMDFSHDNQSLISEAGRIANLVVIKSLTKIYSLAGLRIGFLVAENEIINIFDARLPLWNVNGIAVEMAKRMLSKSDFIEKTKCYIEKEKKRLLSVFESYSDELKCYSSYANFLLCESRLTKDIMIFAKKSGFALRDNRGFFGLGDRFFRLAVKSYDENTQLILMFENFFKVSGK